MSPGAASTGAHAYPSPQSRGLKASSGLIDWHVIRVCHRNPSCHRLSPMICQPISVHCLLYRECMPESGHRRRDRLQCERGATGASEKSGPHTILARNRPIAVARARNFVYQGDGATDGHIRRNSPRSEGNEAASGSSLTSTTSTGQGGPSWAPRAAVCTGTTPRRVASRAPHGTDQPTYLRAGA